MKLLFLGILIGTVLGFAITLGVFVELYSVHRLQAVVFNNLEEDDETWTRLVKQNNTLQRLAKHLLKDK